MEELAQKTGLPSEGLKQSIERYNRMVRAGEDEDFQRFGKHALPPWLQVFPVPEPRELVTPPFYAMQAFPMTRKNMGGLRIDTNCRVLDMKGQAIPGLFAVGEVAGLGGVNGKAGLEGTFLGPSLVQGRRAGRVLSGLPLHNEQRADEPATPSGGDGADGLCRTCHTLPMRLFAGRDGFRHFARSHKMAAERNLSCRRCHPEIEPLNPLRHRIADASLMASCDSCHLPWTGTPPATR